MFRSGGWLLPIFLLSGCAALVYQVVWQRALFSIFGIDTTSVTIVIAAFMLGLGIGSHLGGELSRRYPPLPLFAVFELGIGAFGFFSLAIFDAASHVSLTWSRGGTALMTFLLVLVPTTLMGATLPLLVADAAKKTGNVGKSVGTLYFVNTLGAGAACFLTVYTLFPNVGMSGAVRLAAGMNVLLALSVFALSRTNEVRS